MPLVAQFWRHIFAITITSILGCTSTPLWSQDFRLFDINTYRGQELQSFEEVEYELLEAGIDVVRVTGARWPLHGRTPSANDTSPVVHCDILSYLYAGVRTIIMYGHVEDTSSALGYRLMRYERGPGITRLFDLYAFGEILSQAHKKRIPDRDITVAGACYTYVLANAGFFGLEDVTSADVGRQK